MAFGDASTLQINVTSVSSGAPTSCGKKTFEIIYGLKAIFEKVTNLVGHLVKAREIQNKCENVESMKINEKTNRM